METPCGGRLTVLRDTPTDERGMMVTGQVVWVVGHRGDDPVVVDEQGLSAVLPAGTYRSAQATRRK